MILNDLNTSQYSTFNFWKEHIKATIHVYTPDRFLMRCLKNQAMHPAFS